MLGGASRRLTPRAGELLEKTTRVLTDEEKAQLEVEFVGKNGSTRKIEVRVVDPLARAR
jgi:hypothetical protein